MTHTIAIETQSDRDYALFKELADRLGLRMEESYSAPGLHEAEEKALLKEIAGSWQGGKTGDELAVDN